MAAARSVTPGGALLRGSRMFAIPAPIPPPPEFAVGTKGSLTKTTAFPTHQIITTTNAARRRGDWGLKRPLPLRATTKATYGMVRINEIDTIEGITDYSSATDLGITLKKFQQLNLPITLVEDTSDVVKKPLSKDQSKPRKSVFDEDRDFTHMKPSERVSKADKRWKFTGPWLAGMGHAEFNQWLEKKVKPRRAEFHNFLREKMVQEVFRKDAQKAMDNGIEAPAVADPSSISDEMFMEHLRYLRNDRPLLFDLVGQFLDLAPLKAPTQQLDLDSDSPLMKTASSPYSNRGPPITHPSAGLSYLRSSAFVENHPFYGPQKEHAPVQARVIKPRRPGETQQLKIGVAGIIAGMPGGDSASNRRNNKQNGYLDRIDITKYGGEKVWVQPREATIDSRGRVNLTVDNVDNFAYLVTQELLGADEKTTFRPPEQPKHASRGDQIRNRFDWRGSREPRMSGPSQYGLSGYKQYKPQAPRK